MRKPLTLFETVIAALLAALIFGNLLSNLIRMNKAKSLFTQKKEIVLGKAQLHTQLKTILGSLQEPIHVDGEGLRTEHHRLSVIGNTLFFDDRILYSPITSFEIEVLKQEEGNLIKHSVWEKGSSPDTLRFLINSEPYIVHVTHESKGFLLCK